MLRSGVDIFSLDYDAILAAMYALTVSAEGDCYLCVPLDPRIEAAAPGAIESALPGTSPAEALQTFTLDSGASRSFFRNRTTLTPLPAPVPVRLADPSEGPVLARSTTVLPCPGVPSGSLSGLHLPSFSTNLLKLWPCVSLLETSPTLRWMGKVGDASVFRVWGSCTFVCATSADKLSSCAIPCVFLGFPLEASGSQFYQPTSRRVLPSQDITFDELVPFDRLFPYPIAPLRPLAALPRSRSPSDRPPPPSGSCSLRCVSGRPTPLG
ncbi:unnamed protein product [Closterium sp. NIES-54]